MTSEQPEYLKLLHQAWVACDRPTARDLAGDLGVSHETIRATLNGKSVPRQKLLIALAHALTLEQADYAAIVQAYNGFQETRRVTSLPPQSRVKSRISTRDAEIIANAVREGLADIAAAIRGESAPR